MATSPAKPPPAARVGAFTERDLITATRRFKAREAAFQEAVAERDRLIRAALGAKVPYSRIMGITGLSRPRISQVRRGARI
jgi:hypothetical protein